MAGRNSRRTLLKGAGAATIAALAGCLGDDNGGGDGDDVDEPDEDVLSVWHAMGGG
jgi:sn-glycerol 3-phosphate transport system substrate-binding protein